MTCKISGSFFRLFRDKSSVSGIKTERQVLFLDKFIYRVPSFRDLTEARGYSITRWTSSFSVEGTQTLKPSETPPRPPSRIPEQKRGSYQVMGRESSSSLKDPDFSPNLSS